MFFLTKLDVRVLPKSGMFASSKPFVFIHKYTDLVEIPKGTPTDFASVPLIKNNGLSRKSAFIHDFLYSKKGRVNAIKLSRKQCDRIFLDAMKLSGVGFIKRQAMYRGVRAFGGIHLLMTSGKGWDD